MDEVFCALLRANDLLNAESNLSPPAEILVKTGLFSFCAISDAEDDDIPTRWIRVENLLKKTFNKLKVNTKIVSSCIFTQKYETMSFLLACCLLQFRGIWKREIKICALQK